MLPSSKLSTKSKCGVVDLIVKKLSLNLMRLDFYLDEGVNQHRRHMIGPMKLYHLMNE